MNDTPDDEIQSFPTFILSIADRRFELGQIVATPGVLESCPPSRRWHCFASHARGDWGIVCSEDAASNDDALKEVLRVLSAYAIDPTKPSTGFGATLFGLSPKPTAARPRSCCRASINHEREPPPGGSFPIPYLL